jgi:hypothetical protein
LTFAARTLAIWLTPAAWLALPALVLESGPDGLWIGLVLLVAPLLALAVAGAVTPPASTGEALFPVLALLLVVGILFWANLVLAGDVAAWLGAARWQGIAVAAGGAWILLVWRRSGRLVPVLLLVAGCGLVVPMLALAGGARMGPLGAWERVASLPAFRLPASSPWASPGRELRAGRGPGTLVFEEEHRVTAAGPAQLHVRAVDGARVTEGDWDLRPGDSVTLRPGDELRWPPGARLRFEVGKTVPGAPSSGISWADGRRGDSSRRWGLLLTLCGGALALLGFGIAGRVTRREMAVTGAALIGVFAWGVVWAVYCALGSPDLFLGGVAIERLAWPPTLKGGPGVGGVVSALLPLAALASFLASSMVLRARIGALDVTGDGEIGHDLGLWSAIVGGAALASLWPVEPWGLMLVASGLATSTLAPAVLWPPGAGRGPWGTWAGLVGLVVFGTLAVAGQWTNVSESWAGLPLAYPAVVAAPAAALVLGLARRPRKS